MVQHTFFVWTETNNCTHTRTHTRHQTRTHTRWYAQCNWQADGLHVSRFLCSINHNNKIIHCFYIPIDAKFINICAYRSECWIIFDFAVSVSHHNYHFYHFQITKSIVTNCSTGENHSEQIYELTSIYNKKKRTQNAAVLERTSKNIVIRRREREIAKQERWRERKRDRQREKESRKIWKSEEEKQSNNKIQTAKCKGPSVRLLASGKWYLHS